MSFQLQRGLFGLDFIDHYAILGIAIDADVKEVRKRYLKVARRLHPDSCSAERDTDKQLAEKLLSKLVNPAWEALSQERSRIEYGIVLKLKGQTAAHHQQDLEIGSSLAQQLLSSANPDHFYHTTLQDLAERQYQQLDQVLELTAQISELNLVYLIKKESTSSPTARKSSATTPPKSTAQPAAKPAQPEPEPQESLVDQFYRRAEGYLKKGNLTQAMVELRDALKIEPNNGRCHGLMGLIYLQQNQPTMAKIHFNKAIAIDPQNEIAQAGLRKLAGSPKSTDKTASQPSPKPAKKDDRSQSNGGLFGGLFGGKKK
jgi:curved DNA-binding protein CbpA